MLRSLSATIIDPLEYFGTIPTYTRASDTNAARKTSSLFVAKPRHIASWNSESFQLSAGQKDLSYILFVHRCCLQVDRAMRPIDGQKCMDWLLENRRRSYFAEPVRFLRTPRGAPPFCRSVIPKFWVAFASARLNPLFERLGISFIIESFNNCSFVA